MIEKYFGIVAFKEGYNTWYVKKTVLKAISLTERVVKNFIKQ